MHRVHGCRHGPPVRLYVLPGVRRRLRFIMREFPGTRARRDGMHLRSCGRSILAHVGSTASTIWSPLSAVPAWTQSMPPARAFFRTGSDVERLVVVFPFGCAPEPVARSHPN